MGSKVLKKTRERSVHLALLPECSNSIVEETLWLSIQQKAFTTEIHVCFDIELVCCPWTIWILGHQAEAVLLIVGA
jgi:hypothetical protein